MRRCLKRPILPGMKERVAVADRAYLSERQLVARAMLDRCGSWVWIIFQSNASVDRLRDVWSGCHPFDTEAPDGCRDRRRRGDWRL